MSAVMSSDSLASTGVGATTVVTVGVTFVGKIALVGVGVLAAFGAFAVFSWFALHLSLSTL